MGKGGDWDETTEERKLKKKKEKYAGWMTIQKKGKRIKRGEG